MTHAQSNSRRLSLWQVLLFSALNLIFFRGRSDSAQKSHRRPASEKHRSAATGGSPGRGAFGSTRSIDQPRNLDERSYEPERGRGAEAPWQTLGQAGRTF